MLFVLLFSHPIQVYSAKDITNLYSKPATNLKGLVTNNYRKIMVPLLNGDCIKHGANL